jgi:hypothetical protein
MHEIGSQAGLARTNPALLVDPGRKGGGAEGAKQDETAVARALGFRA